MPQELSKQDNEIHEGKILAAVSYWLFLCILPLILKKDNKFAVYHGKQGLVLFIFLVGAFILYTALFPLWFLWKVVFLVYFLLLLWGTIQALSGKYCRIPIISKIAEKIIL